MPQLEWVFFGQIQIGSQNHKLLAEVVEMRIPVALTTKRDSSGI